MDGLRLRPADSCPRSNWRWLEIDANELGNSASVTDESTWRQGRERLVKEILGDRAEKVIVSSHQL